MARLVSRLDRLERAAAPPIACPTCGGNVWSLVTLGPDAAGRIAITAWPKGCPSCGRSSPTWVDLLTRSREAAT